MLGPRTADKLCIKSDWVWHTFVDDIKNGKFKEILNEISKELNTPINLLIQASAIMDKESSNASFEELESNNIIEFNYDGVSLKCIKENVKGELRAYTNIEKVGEFTNIFEAKDMEWFWIDFYAVIEVRSSDWNQIETIVPTFINSYQKIF
jgi:hypothetical protein